MNTVIAYHTHDDQHGSLAVLPHYDSVSTAIYATTHYAQFKLDAVNRPINPDKLERLYDAVSVKNLLADNPILVSLDFVVLDGQHRLRVAEALETPIFYQFASDTTIDDVASLNSNRSSWKFADYLCSWCARGNPEYIKLREFIRRYDWMIPTMAMELCHYGTRLGLRRAFTDGRYVCNDIEFAEKVAQGLLDFRSFGFRYWNSRVFMYAVGQLFANSDYNHDIMIKRLGFNREALHPAVNSDDYFKMFNRIYNHKARGNKTVLEKLNVSDSRYRADMKAKRSERIAA